MIETCRGYPLHFSRFKEAASSSQRRFNRCGAEEARRFTLWAHNSEVTGSTPVAGIYSLCVFYRSTTSQLRRR